MLRPKVCDHLLDFTPSYRPRALVCEECVKTGKRWVHLRTCQSCGATLCCDSSPEQHARKHYKAQPEHRVAISAEPGENWAWCYEDNKFVIYGD